MNSKFKPVAVTLLAVFASACIIGTPALAGSQTDDWKALLSGGTFTVLPKGASESNVPWVTSWKDEQFNGYSRQTYTNLTFNSYLQSQVVTESGFDKTNIAVRMEPITSTDKDGVTRTTCMKIDCNGVAQTTLIETMKNGTDVMPLWLKGTAAEDYLQSLPGSTAIVARGVDPFNLGLPLDRSLLETPRFELSAPDRLLGPAPDQGASGGGYPDTNDIAERASGWNGGDYGGSEHLDQGFDPSGENFGPGF